MNPFLLPLPRVLLRPSLGALAFGLLLAGTLPASARAQGTTTLTQRRITTYRDSDVSVWSPGRDTGSNLKSILVGPEFTIPSTTIGGIGEIVIPQINLGLIVIPSFSLGKTGAKISFNGRVKAGITVKPWYSGGRLEYTYRAAVDVTYPKLPIVGQSATVTARFAGVGGSNFSTSSPSFGASFGAVGQIVGHADTKAWFLGYELFRGDVFDFSETPPEREIGGLIRFDVPDEVNFIIDELNGQLNPIPIGVQFSRPDVETHGTTVRSDGTIQASALGTFLSVETDLLGWMTALLPPPASEAISRVASGNYLVPGTDYRVGWDFCRSFANLDVGLYSEHTLGPRASAPPQVTLAVYNAKTNAFIASGTNGSVTFTMPIDGIRVEPTLNLSLGFKNRLSIGTGGSIGSEPLRVTAAGSFGSGDRAKAIDFDFSVGSLVWEGDPSAGTKILDDEFTLPEPPAGRSRTLPSVGTNSFNGLELPREVFGTVVPGTSSANEPTIYVPAYSTDVATGDINRDYKVVSITAEQGRTFFAARATFTATLNRIGQDPVALELNGNQDNFNESVSLRIPTRSLSPGQHTVELNVDTRNVAGQARSAKYFVPLTAYNPRVDTVSPQLFTQQDLAPNSVTNRVVADNRDTVIYLGGARGVLPSTQMILDGTTVLENDWQSKDEITLAGQFSNGITLGFTLTPALKAEMSGRRHIVRLRAPSTVRGADGNLLPPFESIEIPIFVVAESPNIDGISYEDQPVASLPMVPTGDLSFDVNGKNFTKSTSVFFNFAGSVPAAAVKIPATFTSSTTMRVKLEASLLAYLNVHPTHSFTLRAETPVETVPADAQSPEDVSGGVSPTVGFSMHYPTPKINRITVPGDTSRLPVCVRGVATTIRVYGDNFFVSANGTVNTKFLLDGSSITAVLGPGGTGIGPACFDITLPAVDNNLASTLTVWNPGVVGSSIKILNENGVPALTTFGTNLRVRIPAYGQSFQAAGTGGPIYDETTVLLGGIEFPTDRDASSAFRVHFPSGEFDRIPGKTTAAVLRNPAPGGGDSSSVTVVLEEGDPSKIIVTKGLLAYDRASKSWKQEITLKYNGTRTLDGNVNLQFRNLPAGVQLLSASGTEQGFPYRRVQMNGTTPVKLVALFRQTGTNAISFSNVVTLP